MVKHAGYARLTVPLAVEGTFTYVIPTGLREHVVPGMRVLVPFGKRRIYTAIVLELTESLPEGVQAREILECLDEQAFIPPHQLQLWSWMWSYYMSTPGEVMRAALPSGLRPESESKVRISPDFEDQGEMDAPQRLLHEVVRDEGELSMAEVELTGIAGSPLKVLKQLVDLGAVELNEFVPRAKRKLQRYLVLGESLQKEQALVQALDKLNRAPRQLGILERFLLELGDSRLDQALSRKLLIRESGDAGALSSMVKKGLLVELEREESDGDLSSPLELSPLPELHPSQSEALEHIRQLFEQRQTVLLHGVTSSGKTEIYMHLMEAQLKEGKQVLYLLPEIALTTQIIRRIRQVFGPKVGVYHSRYSDRERVHVYRNLLGLTDEEPYQIVVGVRSALFLPFQRLGMVVIDEEHEHTFKQQDPAPRYHARDSAQILALFSGARVILGTATPSFESLHNARVGKFGYVHLDQRFGKGEAPEIILADVREATRKKQMTGLFSPPLEKAIREAMEKGEQVILFQNRRGYAPYLICKECAEIPKCRRCDVSLTFHRESRKLECHYCGHKENLPSACPSCGSTAMLMKGFGTEKIEDELSMVIEDIRVGRLDTDTARSRKGTEKILRDFEEGKLDVLVGTQMVSKGLDFARVSLVGILDADSMLHFPDFRAFERSFQLIHQVSGRAGRRKERGKVIVQTSDPAHPVIQWIREGDYEGLYQDQMEERQLFHYPPYTRMIRIIFRHKIPSILDAACAELAASLKEVFGNRVLGPQYPGVRKIQLTFVKHILIKVEKEASYERAKALLAERLAKGLNREVYRSIRVSLDVDPY